jgi:hypothetical protein
MIGNALKYFSKNSCLFLLLVLLMISNMSWGQAVLPVSRTAWGTTPTGWTDNAGGTYLTTFACSGSNGGKFAATNDNYVVNFSGTPGTLSFVLKATATPTGCSMLVEESSNGISYTTVAGTFTLSTTCTTYGSINLLSTTRFVKWTYTKSGTVNLTFDDVNISASSCTAPSTQTSALTATTPTTDGLSLSWIAGNGDGTMVSLRPTTQAIALPSSGTSYTASTVWGLSLIHI